MSELFFNNAQMEKFEALRYILSINRESGSHSFSSEIAMDRHRIRTINKDLIDCNIPLKIKANLTYAYTNSDTDWDLVSYYNKKTLTVYHRYLLKQSNLFRLITYLIKNKETTIETAACDLNISNSYIYKLIAHFNEVSDYKYGVRIEIIKKSINFIGKEENLIVSLFEFYSISPESNPWDFRCMKEENTTILKQFRPYLIKILQKNDSFTDSELLYALYKSLYSNKQDRDTIEAVGYDLVQSGGAIVNLIENLIKYFSYEYTQINLKELIFYIPELIKLIVFIIVKTDYHKLSNDREIKSSDIDYEEILILESFILAENLYVERKKIKAILQLIKRFLNNSKTLASTKVYVKIVDSMLLTQLYENSIIQLFNSNTIEIVSDINNSDIIITNDMSLVFDFDQTKFVYVIKEVVEEFERKDYLQFLIKIVKKISKQSF